MSKEVSNYVINKKLNLLFELMIIKADANGSAKRCFPEKYEALKEEFEDLKRVNG